MYPFWIFLNSVCRHERNKMWAIQQLKFLNGVCRHEPYA
ncbi:hypothetical protein URS_2248 [Acinetobacter ursingii]|nr:hypothetical protein URS_2248 [Acinetobacter ursingii]